jgi:cation diffusion facilitator CzcD-associated flavoprotein CzcO
MQSALIIGAGFGGLCAAIRLQGLGVPFTVVERAQDIGGTWRDNTYPGCACDIRSVLYSFSFAPNRAWTRPYPQQPEILAYLHNVLARYNLAPRILFGFEATEARWDDKRELWTLTARDGRELQAPLLISATGPLNKPALPDLPGLGDFAGPQFHSNQWRHDVSLAGKRVAVIGTGASAIQFVPEIAKVAAQVTVFQRTPPWVVPRMDYPFSPVKRWALRHVPGLQALARAGTYWRQEMLGLAFRGNMAIRNVALWHLRTQLEKGWAAQPQDTQLRRAQLRQQLTPDYEPGCKRVLVSDDWYPTLTRPNLRLVASGVARVSPQAVEGADGTVHEADVIVHGTGFVTTEFVTPMRVFGERGVELSAHWRAGPAATHLGITVAGYPNFFMLVGPNTGLGHNSIVFMIECQMNYVMGALRAMQRTGRNVLRLNADAQTNSYSSMQSALKNTVWAKGGCKSWYQSADGHIDTLWPGSTTAYWWRTRRFDLALYS